MLQKMRARSSIFDDIDWVLVAIYSLMVLFGWLSIYAATFDEAHRGITDMTHKSRTICEAPVLGRLHDPVQHASATLIKLQQAVGS